MNPGGTTLTTYLDRILSAHRRQAEDDQRSLDAVLEGVAELEPCRGFCRSIEGKSGLAVVSEIKRRSPSKGALNQSLNPATMAQQYEDGGASCLSVLTDPEFFGGTVQDLVSARRASSVPVLRKDFTVSALDVADARLMGADAVLLIVAALDDHELLDFHQLGIEIGLDVLVETHDEAEVERAMGVGATLVGVNQRDLVTFQVDTERAVRVGQTLPSEVVRVAESGVAGVRDATVLYEAGYHAVLVGESLVKAGNPRGAVASLTSIGRSG